MYLFKIFLPFVLFMSVSAEVLTSKQPTLEPVSLQLQWKYQFESAGFYAAKDKGFYEEVGLDVNFLEFDYNSSVVGNVLSDKAQYGVAYSSIVIDYLKDKPIVLLANFFK